jgi:hypothetical protein
MRKIFIRLALAAGVVTGIAAATAGIPSRVAHTDGAFIPDPQVAKIAAVGFEAVLADLHWIRAVQIVGSARTHVGHGATIGALIDVVTTLDPWVDHPYRFAAVWMNDDEASVRQANELIRRGIKHHPDDWRGYFYLAFNHFFYLGEQREAARALKPALDLKGRPAYLTRLAARLESHEGGLDASAAFLSELAHQAANDDEREAFLGALEEIETERRARFLDTARAEYVRRHQRDIASVDDLVRGGVLRRLPEDPYGEGWEISALTGEIVSKRLRFRYDVKIDGTSRKQLAAFRERSLEKQDE